MATAVLSVVPAGAIGSFRSTTTLHIAVSADGRRLVLTAAVSGSLGTPAGGTVVFIDNHRHLLGTDPLPSCAATCTVVQRVAVSSLARRVSGIFASYSGNATLASSTASLPVLYRRCRAATCSVTLTGDQTSFGVTLAKGQTALATLGAQPLPCSIGAGQVVNLVTSGRSGNIAATLYEAGDAGNAYAQQDNDTFDSYAGHSAYRCLVTDHPFTGFTPGGSTAFSRSTADFRHYGTTPRIGSGHYRGQYAGLIADCYQLATHAHTATGACENLPKLTGPIPDIVELVISGGHRISHLAG